MRGWRSHFCSPLAVVDRSTKVLLEAALRREAGRLGAEPAVALAMQRAVWLEWQSPTVAERAVRARAAVRAASLQAWQALPERRLPERAEWPAALALKIRARAAAVAAAIATSISAQR